MNFKYITNEYGWKDLGVQKMKVMESYTKDSIRMNIYTTTNRVTFQDLHKQYDKGQSFSFFDEESFKNILKCYTNTKQNS